MPAKLVYDIFSMKGVAPKWKSQIDSANTILKAANPEVAVAAELGEMHWFWKKDGIGDKKDPAMGAMPAGAKTSGDYRYSQDQKDLMNHELLSDKENGVKPGHIPVIWAESFSTGELGEAVNNKVWDTTYKGRNGIFMSNASAGYDGVLLHETGHLVADLQHNSPDDPNGELMNAHPTFKNISKAHKEALQKA